MAEELDPKQQKLGNSGGEGVDNRFWIGSLDWFSKYSNVTAGSNIQISKQCGNSSGFFDIRTNNICTVNQAQTWSNSSKEKGELYCLCNVTTNPNVSNEECCHFACCKHNIKLARRLMVQKIAIKIQTNKGFNNVISRKCGNSSGFFDIRTKSDCMGRCRTPMRNEEGELTWLCKETTNLNVLNEECCHFACCKRMKKMAKWLMVQNLHIIIQTNLANITNSMTTKTEMVSIDIPHSTTPLNSGSAPTRRQQYLALIQAAILIYIHRRRQANFL